MAPMGTGDRAGDTPGDRGQGLMAPLGTRDIINVTPGDRAGGTFGNKNIISGTHGDRGHT